MVTREALKKIVMLSYLSDEMLDRLLPITELQHLEEGAVVFRQGNRADRLYMLKKGKVLLEQQISALMTVSISSIKPGFAFGWSAMLDQEYYTTDATCVEPCQIFSFREEKLKALCNQDHHMGYILSQRLLRVIKKRYDIRTEQFVKAIKTHPDRKALL